MPTLNAAWGIKSTTGSSGGSHVELDHGINIRVSKRLNCEDALELRGVLRVHTSHIQDCRWIVLPSTSLTYSYLFQRRKR